MPVLLPLIHVGFCHSGTKSLQKNIFSRRPEFFYAGIPYDTLGGIFSAIKYQEAEHYSGDTAVSQWCDEFIFAKMRPEKRLVISDETLVEQPEIYFTPAMMPVRTIAERLRARFGPSLILFTLRNQYHYVVSNYLVLKKNYADLANRGIEPFDEWFAGNLSQQRNLFLRNLDPSHAIKLYQSVFGKEAVHVLPLELLLHRGTGAYLGCLGRIVDLSFSEVDVESYVAYNRSPAHSIVLSKEQRSIICQRSAIGNAFVAKEFKLPLRDFGYPLPD